MTTRVVRQAAIPGSQIDWRIFVARLARLLAGMLVIAALVMGWMKLNDPDFLPITKIRAQGTFINLTEDMLVSKAGNIHGAYFHVDVRAIQEKIESLAWVDKAYVRRMWPDTLMISVTEQRAKALWHDSGLINPGGKLFFPDKKTFPMGLPVLSGPEGSHQQLLEQYQSMSQALRETGLMLQQLEMDKRRSLTLHLDNGVKILLGRQAHYIRLERFIRMYKKILVTEMGRLRQIDMRYTNGFTILRKQ